MSENTSLPQNWLFLRGLGRERRHWGEFAARFQEELGLENVVGLDLPGVGTECRRMSPTSITGIVDDLRDRWLTLRESPKESWGLLTISLGGMVGMNWCSRFPLDFGRFVLINSSARGLSPLWHRLTPLGMKELAKAVAKTTLVEREKQIIEMTTAMQSESDISRMAQEWGRFSEESPLSVKAFAKQLVAAATFKVPHRISVPTLVLASHGDSFVNPNCSDSIAKHFKFPIKWHEKAGHDLPLDAPEWVIEQIQSMPAG